MALGATHIKFAVDLKERYQVEDLQKYISGTIYPDSRYITGVDRDQTHSDQFLDQRFYAKDDFKKGWAVHLICDKAQFHVLKNVFPEEFVPEKFDRYPHISIEASALKGVQDSMITESFAVQEYLPFLDYLENPNNEDLSQLKKHNQIFQKMYAETEKSPAQLQYEMWLALGVGEEIADKIKQQTEYYLKNSGILNRMQSVYEKMLARQNCSS